MLVSLIAGLLAQQRVQTNVARWRRVRTVRPYGAQAARALLDAHGLARVRIVLLLAYVA